MKIKMTLDRVSEVMAIITSVTQDVILWYNNKELKFVAYSGNIISATTVKADVYFDIDEVESDFFHQLNVKEITNVLGAFKSLKKTRVDSITFEIAEKEAKMLVAEVPLNLDEPGAHLFNQTFKTRITKMVLKDHIKNEILKLFADNKDFVEVNRHNLSVYLNTLLPIVAKEKKDATDNILFEEKHIYTTLPTHISIMENKLEDIFSGFRLPNMSAAFLRSFAQAGEYLKVHKDHVTRGLVVVTVANGETYAVLKLKDMSKSLDLAPFLSLPENGLKIDKMYLSDVLKRVRLTTETVFVDVEIHNGVGALTLESPSVTQKVPIMQAVGELSATFSIKVDLLAAMIFNHTGVTLDKNIFIYLNTADGKVTLGCADNSKLWHTKIMGIPLGKSNNFGW